MKKEEINEFKRNVEVLMTELQNILKKLEELDYIENTDSFKNLETDYISKYNQIKELITAMQAKIETIHLNIHNYNLVPIEEIIDPEVLKEIDTLEPEIVSLERELSMIEQRYTIVQSQKETSIQNNINENERKKEEARLKRLAEKRKVIEELLKQTPGYMILEDSAECTNEQYGYHLKSFSRTRVIPKFLVELHSKKLYSLPSLISDLTDDYYFVFDDRKFYDYETADLSDKQIIKEKEKRISEIMSSKDKKFDKKGTIQFQGEEGKIAIPITPRELAEMGILYEDLQWVQDKITIRDIAHGTRKIPSRLIERAGELLSTLRNHKGGKDENDRVQ